MDEQPLPELNPYPSVPSLVVDDLRSHSRFGASRHAVMVWVNERQQTGIARYGTSLQPFTGNDAVSDLGTRVVDAALYARQALVELGATVPEHADLPRLAAMYEDLLGMACAVAEMRAARAVVGEAGSR